MTPTSVLKFSISDVSRNRNWAYQSWIQKKNRQRLSRESADEICTRHCPKSHVQWRPIASILSPSTKTLDILHNEPSHVSRCTLDGRRQLNTVYFSKLYFHTTLPSTSWSPNWPLSLKFSYQICVWISQASVFSVSRLSHPLWLDHPNNTVWRRVKIMTLLTV